MAVTIRCPNPACGRSGSVPADLAGHSVRCPHSGTRFEVPPRTGQGPPASLVETKGSDAPAIPTLGPAPAPAERNPAPAGSAAAAPVAIGRFQIRARLGA